MLDLKQGLATVNRHSQERLRRLETTERIAKIVNTGGVAIIAAATVANNDLVVYAAAFAVALGSVWLLYSEQASVTMLSDAKEAMDAAQAQLYEQQRELETLKRQGEAALSLYISEINRINHYQAARDAVRALFEAIALSPDAQDEALVIQSMLDQTRRELFLALGFKEEDYHTICVYRREIRPDGSAVLEIQAHIRSVDCPKEDARKWPEGFGAAGSACALRREVVVEDVSDPELIAQYKLPPISTENDRRYGSIVAEPVSLDGGRDIWGVLVATSREKGHFTRKNRRYVDIAQSLTGMVSLAVKLAKSKRPKST